jgi:hypothetical protein
VIVEYCLDRRQSFFGPLMRAAGRSMHIRRASLGLALSCLLGLPSITWAESGRSRDEVVAQLSVPPSFLSPLGRQFLRYAVSCALSAGQAARVPSTSTSEAEEVLEGAMGLAPEWASRGLLPREERLISACLLARTNFFGVPVQLSLRRSDALPGSPLDADLEERNRYSRLEARFFGNLFAPGQPAYFCRGDDLSDRSRWLRSLRRVCAVAGDAFTGLSACGFVDVGVCASSSLRQGGVDYADSAIDVFLPPLAGSSVAMEKVGLPKD